MSGHFFALDVETANRERSSICQIGIVEVKDRDFISEWSTYVNPKDSFEQKNIDIHGIDENTVAKAPYFSDIAAEIFQLVHQKHLVCHYPFDRQAINAASKINQLKVCEPIWLDSAKIAQRAWEGLELISEGVALDTLAKKLNIQFRHHDALEDAKVCAQIVLKACKDTGLSINDWAKKQTQPIKPKNTTKYDYRRTGHNDGSLSGQVIVLTGSDGAQIRREIADKLNALGAKVDKDVTKKTTILIVGKQDPTKLAGYKTSSKQRKAEKLIDEKNQDIEIISETDFNEKYID